jgi:hypothetical protein
MPQQSRGERKKEPITAPTQYDRTDRPIKRSQKLSNQRIVRGSLTGYQRPIEGEVTPSEAVRSRQEFLRVLPNAEQAATQRLCQLPTREPVCAIGDVQTLFRRELPIHVAMAHIGLRQCTAHGARTWKAGRTSIRHSYRQAHPSSRRYSSEDVNDTITDDRSGVGQ